MLSQEDALEEFLENSKSTQKGTNSIYYNRSMESLIEYPFVFNYELESKIGKLVKGTKIKLDNYKDAIIFKRAITVEEMNKKILNMKTLQNFGDEKITVTKLLEISSSIINMSNNSRNNSNKNRRSEIIRPDIKAQQ